MSEYRAKIQWEPAFGLSPIRIALVTQNGDKVTPVYETLCFWPGAGGTSVQKLDEFRPFLEDNDGPPPILDGQAYRAGDRLVRCGSQMTTGNWELPTACIYRLVGRKWTVVKTEEVGGGKLATMPSTHFLRRGGTVDPNAIVAVYNVYPTHLGQPHSGPLLLYSQVWQIHGDQFHKLPQKLVPTPLSELNLLAGLAQAGKRTAFNAAVPKQWQSDLWDLLKDKVSFSCVGNRQESTCSTLIHPYGADKPEFTLHFAKSGGGWRLDRVVE